MSDTESAVRGEIVRKACDAPGEKLRFLAECHPQWDNDFWAISQPVTVARFSVPGVNASHCNRSDDFIGVLLSHVPSNVALLNRDPDNSGLTTKTYANFRDASALALDDFVLDTGYDPRVHSYWREISTDDGSPAPCLLLLSQTEPASGLECALVYPELKPDGDEVAIPDLIPSNAWKDLCRDTCFLCSPGSDSINRTSISLRTLEAASGDGRATQWEVFNWAVSAPTDQMDAASVAEGLAAMGIPSMALEESGRSIVYGALTAWSRESARRAIFHPGSISSRFRFSIGRAFCEDGLVLLNELPTAASRALKAASRDPGGLYRVPGPARCAPDGLGVRGWAKHPQAVKDGLSAILQG